MPSERPLIVSEGNWLDDADRMLMSKQVDFREPRDRYPVSTLVKLGESQFAPGRLRTIRISKPELFRPGRDPNETRAQQSTGHVDDIDQPEGLAQLRAAEVNRAAELVDSRIRVTADGMHVSRTRRQKTTTTISLRNHGWIYCTAIEPTSNEEWRDLKAMMPSRYDHTSYIYRPRAFALSLGSMLADQFGIRGGEVRVDARIADLHASNRRGSQTIFHGPVVYEQDKFARYTSPRNEFEAFLGKIFIKDKRFEAEREYRFAIWSEDEPAEDHVDLRISLAMREAMLPLITPSCETYPETDPPNSSAPDGPQLPRDSPSAAKLPELTSHEPALPDPLELLSDPSVGVRPHMLGTEPPAGRGGHDGLRHSVVAGTRLSTARGEKSARGKRGILRRAASNPSLRVVCRPNSQGFYHDGRLRCYQHQCESAFFGYYFRNRAKREWSGDPPNTRSEWSTRSERKPHVLC